MTPEPQTLNKEPCRWVSYQAPARPFTYTSAQKYLIMQNKPNFPRFCAKNSYLQEKQTQSKPIQTHFQPKYAENKPNQTQFKTTPTCPGQVSAKAGPSSSFRLNIIHQRPVTKMRLITNSLLTNQGFVGIITISALSDRPILRMPQTKARINIVYRYV